MQETVLFGNPDSVYQMPGRYTNCGPWPRRALMVTRERVQTVIDRIRPLLQSDGGDIELVDVLDNRARVRLTGNCVGCPSAQMTLYFGVETALKEEIPELEELQVV
jgi:Fe-S cluster biogenesis protein NfuA